MEHIIETYGEGTKQLIDILKRTVKIAITCFNKYNDYYYYIAEEIENILFTEIKELGLFDPNTDNILLSNALLDSEISMEFLNSIVLHETAHFICINHLDEIGHGPKFRNVATLIGAPQEFTKTKVSLDLGRDTSSQLSKIKKLLALSESSNPNESHSALLKARTLMAEMNIKNIVDKDFIFASTLSETRRMNAKIKIISYLVRDIAGVYLIKEHTDYGTTNLRCYGTKSQVEIAIYIYEYLNYTLEKEYKIFKETSNVAGRTLEGFYYGIYNEMSSKFNSKDANTDSSSTALEIIRNDNEDKALKYYFLDSKITTTSSRMRHTNREAFEKGKEVGKRTSIHGAINKDDSKNKLFIK
ncbi:MAG: DUF2786 domain-containing protein [Spirochaetaceae bacterium]|nr:DUF2786 domain-containing protein [Spirochaetaceae bacterium]